MLRLGVDVGGTFIKAGVVDETYSILQKVSVPTGGDAGYEAVVKNIVYAAQLAADQAGRTVKDFASVGIGIPGLLNPRTGVVVSAPNLNGWHDVPFLEAIQKLLPVPVSVGNDANCAVVGETLAGAAKGCENVVMLTLGTGVGGGVITDGRLFVGGQGLGAELGHMVLAMEGETCGCGMHGCIEAYCSVTSLVKQTTRAMEADPASAMHEYAKKAGLVDGRTAFECSKMGDKSAIQVVETYCRYLANAIGSLATCFHPDAVLIGGGLSNQREYLMDKLNALLPRYVFAADVIGVPPILRASLGNDAGTIGAAYLDKM
jgi:glucokinase